MDQNYMKVDKDLKHEHNYCNNIHFTLNTYENEKQVQVSK